MPLCTELSVVNANRQEGEISLLKCKRWQCEICNPDNRWRVMQHCKEGRPNLFMTLTVSNKQFEDPDDAARNMRRCFVLFRRYIAKEWNIENIPFIVVFEKHKSGWPHMHLLLRGKFMEWEKLKAKWNDLVGRGSVDIRRIRKREHVIGYLVKYMGKDLQKFEGCKRWWRSQNWHCWKEEREPRHLFGDRLVVYGMNYDRLREQLARDGYEIKKEGKWKFRFRIPEVGLRNGLPPMTFEAHRW